MYAERDSGRKVEEIKIKKSEVKDPKIKFSGKSAELPETFATAAAAAIGICEVAQSCDAVGEESSIQDFPCSSNSMFGESNMSGDAEDQEANKSLSSQNQDDAKEENQAQSLTPEDLKDSNTSPLVFDNPKALSTDSDVGADQSSKTEEDQQEKALKKPDKILPCPRCNSMDTKFCYFNNYNVNQPRHFCKNCHRYWTAGGTMRNMAVGAGRRKNKYNAASQFQHLPEALQSSRLDLPNCIHHPVLNSNGTVIPFTSDTSPSESMVTVSHGSKQKEGDHSSNEEGKTGIPEMILNCHPLPCFPGAPWPWQWCAPPSLPPTFPPASFPLPFYSTPPPYWAWNVPWFIPPNIPLNSGPNSPTLGKHSRDDNEEQTRKEGNHEKRLWVPKTLRICDPIEAAKSSIWATLGIKNDRADSGGGLFKAFQRQTKGEEKTQVLETSTVLQANPAALSRSLNFHESL